jgi:hypothetical protein
LPVTLVYVKLLQNKPKMQLAMRLQKHLALTPIPAYAVSRRQPRSAKFSKGSPVTAGSS